VKARVAGQSGVAEELPFQLEGGLLGGEENQRRPLGVLAQGGANFRQAPESFPGAGRTEEKARLHAPLLAQKAAAEKENLLKVIRAILAWTVVSEPLRRAIPAIARAATKEEGR